MPLKDDLFDDIPPVNEVCVPRPKLPPSVFWNKIINIKIAPIIALIIKKRLINPDKLVPTGFPLDTLELDKIKKTKKENIVIFSARNVDEKQPWLFTQMRDTLGDNNIQFINTLEHNFSKQEYYELLAKSKVVVSFALQENFGFSVAEAVYLGCVPVLPNRLVYPEFYPKKYLYNTFDEACKMVNDNIYGDNNIIENPSDFQDSIERWFND